MILVLSIVFGIWLSCYWGGGGNDVDDIEDININVDDLEEDGVEKLKRRLIIFFWEFLG